MTQVSRPVLIALIAVVGFAGAWMLVLRKHATGSDSAAGPPAAAHSAPNSPPASHAPKAPGMTGLGHAIDRAHGAVAASTASAASTNSAAAQASGDAPAASAASPAPAAAAAPVKAKPVRRNVVKVPVGTTTVLLFAGAGADAVAARQIVRSIHMRRVRTIIAPVTAIPRYQHRFAGLQVTAAPAIVVVGPDHTAQQIIGLPDLKLVLAQIAQRAAR